MSLPRQVSGYLKVYQENHNIYIYIHIYIYVCVSLIWLEDHPTDRKWLMTRLPEKAKESKESRESRVWGLQSGYEQAALKLILKSALAGLKTVKISNGGGSCSELEASIIYSPWGSPLIPIRIIRFMKMGSQLELRVPKPYDRILEHSIGKKTLL